MSFDIKKFQVYYTWDGDDCEYVEDGYDEDLDKKDLTDFFKDALHIIRYNIVVLHYAGYDGMYLYNWADKKNGRLQVCDSKLIHESKLFDKDHNRIWPED